MPFVVLVMPPAPSPTTGMLSLKFQAAQATLYLNWRHLWFLFVPDAFILTES